VDRIYLQSVIDKIEHERKIHDRKFADNPAHKTCLPRFDDTLTKLREELRKLGEEEEE
jgi:hypothetical protein